MHNNIMAAVSRDRPPMLARKNMHNGSRFLRYIDTRPNGDALRKCILKGPYTPTIVTTPVVPAIEDSLAVPEQTTVETVMNMTPENRAHFESEKEAIHLILTGIGDEIYSTVNACQTVGSHRKATTRFYKMMNEMIRNNLTVATKTSPMLQFLQQLQPEWSRFVTIVKQQHKLDEVSYHKLFDILKQYQKEVNELRAERMAKNANPFALVAMPQTLQDPLVKVARETVGGQVVQQSGIQCFNCKEFGHFAKKCRKPKRVKDSTYHKEKMLLCKQTEKGVQFQAKQSDWLAVTDEEIDEQELEAHYSYMEKIQEVPNADSGTDSEPLEQWNTGDSNVHSNSPDMCDYAYSG
ncbi:integrase, catalytic region, zinc finger, CCHC-type containing protein [Tanacetum coccineum]|uniref:Integrase, catalytic region, zinc finger, CCHC-type containing protein n=1 Tax=Tanacetum coccineum TaxID=301880 RepID=A0ABQ5AH47_9ASTR